MCNFHVSFVQTINCFSFGFARNPLAGDQKLKASMEMKIFAPNPVSLFLYLLLIPSHYLHISLREEEWCGFK